MTDQKKFVFFAAITGNILEYYDFTVYLVFYSIIGKAFFPHSSEFAQSIQSLGVFAIGFITRPIGGILFGYIGDTYGRRMSLICSVLGMTIPTFSIGLIPSYEEIGFYAPTMLIIFRLIQGLCISGEGTGAAIFVLEHQNNLRPGFITGLVHGSNIAGTILASFIGIIIHQYFSHLEYAWRFAFILGGFMGLATFYLRLRVSETPIFAELHETKRTLKTPFLSVVRNSWQSMFLTFCVAGFTSSIFYMVKSYVNVFYRDIMHFDTSSALFYSTYASIILMMGIPIAGIAVDRIGKVPVIKFAVCIIILLASPVLIGMSSENLVIRFTSLTILALMAASMSGCAYVFVISLFSPEERFSGVAFSYNLGIAVFGGTSPIISTWLVEYTRLYYAAAFYIMATGLMFLLVLTLMKNIVSKV
ncbi:MAG: MFS transporter [Rickettsiaceae bacterium]|nr:MFS transporter [Rickettsiaceae bacterium]